MIKYIGILGIQGSIDEHNTILDKLSVPSIIVKTIIDLDKISALIIPGGESSVINKFITSFNLKDDLFKFINIDRKPVMGTCAGAIILAKQVMTNGTKSEGLLPSLDIEIERNSYGSHMASFVKEIYIKGIGNYPCIFIRAPKILNSGSCEVLAAYNKIPIMIKKANILLCTFHPELQDEQIHRYFCKLYDLF